jgi:HD-GYP domain-containing protein (c-di-GMP phosphodiesterase class II)
VSARVVAVADVIEAMASNRPYRAALGIEVAMAEITSRPEKFDSLVVAACTCLYADGRLTL